MNEIENQLKNMIIQKYNSLNKFCEKTNIPRSTLQSIFNRGIKNSNIDNIFKICDELSISIDKLAYGIIERKNEHNERKSNLTQREKQHLHYYNQLNTERQKRIDKIIKMELEEQKEGELQNSSETFLKA